MSQINVERIIGQLATDEGLRRRYMASPRAAVLELVGKGVELTDCEQWALTSLDPNDLARFARALDPRLQKTEPRGGTP